MSAKHTPGPWTAYVMTHAERGDLLTPEELGEYVKNSVIKSAQASGTTEFVFVSAELPDGPADICHVGNGPTRKANGNLIAAAPDLLKACKLIASFAVSWQPLSTGDIQEVLKAIAKAEGEVSK